MDCNRDEAARSRGIAEKKFMQQDYLGARKFALKARQLFPDLEGLMQFIAVVDVHVTAHEKLQNGEMNLYGILQSDPYADEASLRKQYRKLALVLHPDKNKALGAETAFKFLCEAWTILSDKAKKAAYDKLRNPIAPKTVPQKKSQPESRPAPQSKQAEKPPCQKKKAGKSPPAACKSQTPHNASSDTTTFWTACPDCKLQYEYHNMYKNKNLCCPFCMKAFFARELSVLVNGQVIWPPLQEQNRPNVDAKSASVNANGSSNGTKISPAKGDFPVSNSHSPQENPEARKENIGVEAAHACKEQVGKIDVEYIETKSRAQGEAYNPSAAKPHVVMEQKLHDMPSEECKVNVNAESKEPPKASTTEGHDAPDEKAGGSVKVPYANPEVELTVSPLKKAKVDVLGSIKEQFVYENLKTGLSEMGFDVKNADHCMPNDFNAKKGQSNVDPMNHEYLPESKPNSCMSDAKMKCDVPDSDFYVFDNDRTEQHFAAGQLWACYDDDDGFPRYYARIVKMISQQPFKIQYTWLEARSESEEVSSWLDSGFSYTCGEFELGKTLVGDSVCMFSHVMAFEKGQKALFKIFPRKGEVWALYKNWDMLKRKEEKHGYDLVEVLSEYSDEVGVQVCMLVKVEGFKSVFKQQLGVVFEVIPDQMRRFSHNIPRHRLIQGEIPECIEGFLELDLASSPMK